MLRRNPTRIEVRSSDRDELEDHLRAAAGTTPPPTTTTLAAGYTTPPAPVHPLLHLLHPPPGAGPSKAQRIGLPTTIPTLNLPSKPS
ncbi:unnamed protein product [Urochloa decumbens]|uniref:Uncharacterized protein n=1 Tax=Urochloa decumbens TaxID=240449 RepID=A0ABC9GWM2_9POAL